MSLLLLGVSNRIVAAISHLLLEDGASVLLAENGDLITLE